MLILVYAKNYNLSISFYKKIEINQRKVNFYKKLVDFLQTFVYALYCQLYQKLLVFYVFVAHPTYLIFSSPYPKNPLNYMNDNTLCSVVVQNKTARKKILW